MKTKIKSFILRIIVKIVHAINKLVPITKDIIIMRTDNIGDFVIWMDSARQLREFYADRKITLICSQAISEIVRESKLFDEVIVRPVHFKNQFLQCIGMKANRIINPRNTFVSSDRTIMAMIAAKEKIVTYSMTTTEDISFLTSDPLEVIKTTDEVIHESERNQSFVNQLLHTNENPKLADLRCYLETRKIDEPYFIINLGASNSSRRWPVDHYVKTATYIANKTGKLCVLIGSAKEVPLANAFAEKYTMNIQNVVGKTSIKEMITYIQYADMVVCNDTSTLHIAAACKVKCFCIAPQFNSIRFVGYPSYLFPDKAVTPCIIQSSHQCTGCHLAGNHIANKDCDLFEAIERNEAVACINDITPEQVIDELEKWL